MTVLALRTARVEARIGRHLTAAETHVDVEAIDELLNRAKDELDAAIRDEQQRFARALAHGRGGHLTVTQDMLMILGRLRQQGQRHALTELASMGYAERHGRAYATNDELEQELRARLRSLTIKINDEALGGDISTVAVAAIERAVAKVLGGRSIAADLVSPAFIAGLADTFEQHADLVERWQYSAVNDGGLCEMCAPHDGEIYDTLDELFEVLPNFGPNPDCLGGDRCRCRAVPVPPDGSEPPPPDTTPPSSSVDMSTSTAFVVEEARAALTEISGIHEIPADAPTLKVRLGTRLPEHIAGQYTPLRLGGPKLAIRAGGDQARLTTLHEYGHYVDDALLGTPGELASPTAAELEDWRTAITGTDAIGTFLGMAEGRIASIHVQYGGQSYEIPIDRDLVRNYYLHPAEIFARSYSQWAAIRSGDPTLLAELHAAQRGPYPEQWSDDDFAPVAAAFDRLIERLGWKRR